MGRKARRLQMQRVIHRPAGRTVIDRISVEQAFELGQWLGATRAQAYDDIGRIAAQVELLINKVQDAMVLTEGLTPARRGAMLRAFFTKKAVGTSYDKLLLDAVYNFQHAIELFEQYLDAGELPPFKHEQAQQLSSIALAFMRGVRVLLDERDNGEALRDVMLENGQETIDALFQTMRENTPGYGRPKGSTGMRPVNHLLGKLADAERGASPGESWQGIARRVTSTLEAAEEGSLEWEASLLLRSKQYSGQGDYLRKQWERYSRQ